MHTYFPRSFFIAVDFFFVLSGFVITQSIFNSKSSNFDSFIKEFTIKRIIRLFPLYILTFIITTIIILFINKDAVDPVFYFITSLFLLQSIGFDAGAQQIFADTSIGIAWSLSVEFWIGLVFFPLIFNLRKRQATLIYSCVFLFIIGTILIFNLSPSIDVNFQKAFGLITFGSIRGLIGFSCGSISYVIFNSFFREIRKSIAISFSELMLLIIIISSLYLPHSSKNEFIASFLFSMFLPLIANENGIIGRILKLNILSTLRYTSYSIYLIHPIVIFLWRKNALPFNHHYAIIFILIVYILSIPSYKLIEKPAMRLKKLFINNK